MNFATFEGLLSETEIIFTGTEFHATTHQRNMAAISSYNSYLTLTFLIREMFPSDGTIGTLCIETMKQIKHIE